MKRGTIRWILASAWLLAAGLLAFSLDEERPGVREESEFTFVRIRYNGYMGSWGRMWGGPPPWAHDYPQAEQNFLKILAELTTIRALPDAYIILDLDDPEIMRHPLLYVSEPGYWNCTEREADNLREYFQRGGFVIFDDFRDEPGEWQNFTRCTRMVFEDRQWEPLTVDHPVFQCFFAIESLDVTPPYPVPGPPIFYGLSDENGRLQAVANFNNDIGDYWEWSHTNIWPISLTNEAYRFGINYVIYAMTH